MGKLRRSLPLHPLQQAFIDCNAVQCGYCTAGFLMVAYAYTQGHESPGREEIREAISGNLCRCTGYVQIIDAIESYVKQKSAGFPEIFAKIEAEEKAAAEAAAKAAAGSTGGHAEPGGEADGGGSGGSGAGATDPPDGGIEEVTLTDADSEAPEAKGGAA
ncbi:MAG: hypothetical protein LBR77_05580 [Lachnospiraceae bacterium]|nr:hypothetical protein [Lachnospiraceae bacterium]